MTWNTAQSVMAELFVWYRSCSELAHLNLGSCNAIASYDDLAVELAKHCT